MGRIKWQNIAYNMDDIDRLKVVTGKSTVKDAIEDAIAFRLKYEKVRQ